MGSPVTAVAGRRVPLPQRPELSIVVPARDEAENLPPLLDRVHAALAGRWRYELVIVDDCSTDATAAVATELGRSLPVVVVSREAGPGKGNALVDGFARSRGEIVCMIDADLQYPPEAIPAMVSLLWPGTADVVVANRVVHRTGLVRRRLSRLSYRVLQALHGLDVDVQSGLKVMRRAVLDSVALHPAGWAIDLELLVQARAAGFHIVTYDIPFEDRRHGRTKVRLGRASWQVLRNAVALRLRAVAAPRPD
jgi:dolichol-phosphate mannosyltransferase